jgi:hypothetical protein
VIGHRGGYGGERGRHERERDEREVGDDDLGAVRQILDPERADVRTVQRGHPGIGSERPRELSVPHVEGRHMRGPAAQQDVREPAGRGSGIERRSIGDDDAEAVQGRVELLAAARNEPTHVRADLHRLVLADHG